MKKLVTACLMLSMVVGAIAVPLAKNIKKVNNLYYSYNNGTETAVLIPSQSMEDDYTYTMTGVITVPRSITIQFEGDKGTENVEYRVMEIAKQAMKDAYISGLQFEDKCPITVIREQGLYGISSVNGTLVMPDSLHLIEKEGIYVKSSMKATSYISELVLPASLDSLSLSSVVLNRVSRITFLGDVPPRCAVLPAAEGTAYNPWTSASAVTPNNIDIVVPAGAEKAYAACKGIGDYFTDLDKYKPVTPTDLTETTTVTAPRKMFHNGQVCIVRDGQYYSLLGVLIRK